MASTMLLLKISRTKKRLSNQVWNLRIMVIAVIGLLIVLSFGLRSTSVSWVYGIVESEIPVLSVPVKDPMYNTFEETPNSSITKGTPIVVLTQDAFLFGDAEAFSEKLHNVRNKYFIRHEDNSPNVSSLLLSLERWMHTRSESKELANRGVLLFLPTKEIPMPIVIQTLSYLRGSPLFERVVLAGGII